MPRSYSSRGEFSAARWQAPPGRSDWRRRRRNPRGQAGLGIGLRDLLPYGAPGAAPGPYALGRHWKPAAAKRLRRAGRVRILVGIEGIATATALPDFLDDGSGRSAPAGNLRLGVATLRLLP